MTMITVSEENTILLPPSDRLMHFLHCIFKQKDAAKSNKQMTQNDMNLQKQNQSSPEDLILCGDFCVLALLTAK